jgi:hypothetical protein
MFHAYLRVGSANVREVIHSGIQAQVLSASRQTRVRVPLVCGVAAWAAASLRIMDASERIEPNPIHQLLPLFGHSLHRRRSDKERRRSTAGTARHMVDRRILYFVCLQFLESGALKPGPALCLIFTEPKVKDSFDSLFRKLRELASPKVDS